MTSRVSGRWQVRVEVVRRTRIAGPRVTRGLIQLSAHLHRFFFSRLTLGSVVGTTVSASEERPAWKCSISTSPAPQTPQQRRARCPQSQALARQSSMGSVRDVAAPMGHSRARAVSPRAVQVKVSLHLSLCRWE